MEDEMNEKNTPEAEVKDTTMEDLEEAFLAVVGETVKLLESLGKAFVKTAQESSNLMIIKVNEHIKGNLDSLVDAGISHNRRAAATTMIEEGIKSKNAAFDQIEKTKAEIANLRQQLHSLVPGQS
jgi:hypothetical protein